MREQAIADARAFFDRTFMERLARRVAMPTESQVPERRDVLRAYLEGEIGAELQGLGFTNHLFPNPSGHGGPYLVSRRVEDPKLPTLFTYGHADVVRGMEGEWQGGRSPWKLERDGDRLYGRGVVDNKGQHTLNLIALAAILQRRGRLGFNVTAFFESSEEVGSPGIKTLCEQQRDLLDADVFIASDGPRLDPAIPTLYLGARGAADFDLSVDYRAGGHHSGNWGGLLANPAIRLANAIASMVDERGRVRVRELVPEKIPDSIRAALAECPLADTKEGPAIDDWWGEPGLSRAEKVFGWNSFEVLAMGSADINAPVNAVPPSARARLHIRYTVDRPVESFLPAIRRHLSAHGYHDVRVEQVSGNEWGATRLDPLHPWPSFIAQSIEKTTGKRTVRVPNFGASLPNDSFAVTLGLPTIFIPHSYRSCSQHAPNEHGLISLFEDGLAIMAGLFWDLGELPWPEKQGNHKVIGTALHPKST